MRDSVKRLAAVGTVLLDAVVKLLVFLSVAFLFYEVFLSRSNSEYHLLYRYARYITDVVTLQAGVTAEGIDAWFYIGPAIRNSLLIFIPAIVMSLAIAYALGVAEFLGSRGRVSRVVQTLAAGVSAMPIYWIAVLLFVLAIRTGWFPIGGTGSAGASSLTAVGRVFDRIHHLVLPWASIMVFAVLFLSSAVGTRVDALAGRDFVRNARAAGLSKRDVLRTHLRGPILAEILSQAAFYLPMLVTYTVLVERVFQYPGLGYYMVQPYARNWWMGADLALSRNALLYLGAGTIAIQTLARIGVAALLPTRRSTDSRKPVDRRLVWAVVAALILGVGVIAFTPEAAFVGGGLFASIALLVARLSPWVVLAALAWKFRGRATKDEPAKHESSERAPSGPQTPRTDARSRVRRLRLRPIIPIGLGAIGAVVVLSFVVPITGPYQPWQLKMALNEGQIGTVVLHYLTEALAGSPFILVPLAGAAIGALVGTVMGTISGHAKLVALDRVVEQLEVFPSVLIMVLVAGLWPERLTGLVATLGLIGALRFYRISRLEVSQLAGREFVQYATFLGTSGPGLLVRHYVPAILPALGHALFILAADLVVLEANLSYLGALYPSGGWSAMLNQTKTAFVRGDYLPALFPALLMILTVALLRVMARSVKRGDAS